VLSTAYTIQPLMRVFKDKGYDLELLDVCAEDANIDPRDLTRKLRPDTKAVIVTHMFGTPARMEEIRIALGEHPCKVIEDAAHAHGAVYRGRRCGTLGDAAFFSLDQVKPLSTFGGGFATTNDDALAAAMRADLAADSPVRSRVGKALTGYFEHALVNSPIFGLAVRLTRFPTVRALLGAAYRQLDRRPPKRNRRLSEMQAFLGRRHLAHLDARLAARRRNATFLAGHCRGLQPQRLPDGAESSYYKFTALAPGDSTDMKERLLRRGVDVGIKDDINYPCYLDLGRSADEFPGTRAVYERLVEIPAYETLSPRRLQRIADALAEII
jgi:dTDP-4-amino-4,6-dideoxygalactose transaminase